MTLFFLSFLGGILTVLAPCILPLLPVIVGGSLTDGVVDTKKALIVTSSLGISVIIFTLILKVSTFFINIPPNVWQWISGGIIIILGLTTLFPDVYEKISFMGFMNRKSNQFLAVGYQKKNIWGDIITGAALGPVFSSCSPTYFIVLASVLPQSLSKGLIDLFAYSLGLGISLFVIALLGQKIISKLGVASDPKGWFKRTLGVLFLIVGIAIISGADKWFEAKLLNIGLFDVTKIEQRLLQKDLSSPSSEQSSQQSDSQKDSNGATPSLTTNSMPTDGMIKSSISSGSKQAYLTIAQKAATYKKVPEIKNPSGFVNTGGLPITISQYIGKKVVLIDFWTYSCINCQRTTPYLNTWYSKYEDKGLVIIGVHTPEFGFEKVQKNVEDATVREGIKYPVVLDNDYSTWNAFGNQFWPRKYLVDIDGYVVYDKIGEGEYDLTEKAIQAALMERDNKLNMDVTVPTEISTPANVTTLDESKLGSPETYFGSSRNEFLANGKNLTIGSQTLSIPETLIPNKLYLGGTWNFMPEYAESQSEVDITYTYKAKNVYMVASSNMGSVIEVYQDGKLVTTSAGDDVSAVTGTGMIKEEKLYSIIENADYEIHTLRIHIVKPGLKAFTFTFG